MCKTPAGKVHDLIFGLSIRQPTSRCGSSTINVWQAYTKGKKDYLKNKSQREVVVVAPLIQDAYEFSELISDKMSPRQNQ